ncbi:hypothetical protein, partial [Qaidamihabitans albus]|uniref:hypothetical protein n=1 Tax=Qaidamihabitans albus TaxID=2795733 RepID=UPI0018F1A773
IIECAARAEDTSVQGGERAVLTVTLSLAELEERTRGAVLGRPGTGIHVAMAARPRNLHPGTVSTVAVILRRR